MCAWVRGPKPSLFDVRRESNSYKALVTLINSQHQIYSLTLKLPITTTVACFVILKVIFANSVDPDQTAPLIRVHTVCLCAKKVWKVCKNIQQTTYTDDIFRSSFFFWGVGGGGGGGWGGGAHFMVSDTQTVFAANQVKKTIILW